jgi:HEAT repeat protein
MGLFGPPNIDKMKAKGDVQGLIKALNYPDIKVAESAANALAQMGEIVVETVAATTQDPDAAVRYHAVWILGQIHSRRSIHSLVSRLDDPEKKVRLAALQALGSVGDGRATEALFIAFKNPDPDIRQSARDSLKKIGSACEVEPLIAAFNSYDKDIRLCAVEILGRLGARAVGPLVTALQAGDPLVRQAAIEALTPIRDVSTLEPLLTALKDEDKDVRRAAVNALAELKDARVIERLIATLSEGNHNLRISAADVLEKIGWQPGKDENGVAYWLARSDAAKCIEIGTPAVARLISSLKFKDYSSVIAARALGGIGDRRAVEPLIAAISDLMVREAAIEALGDIGDRRAVEPLIAVLKGTANDLRFHAAKALGKIGDPRALEPLIAILKDKKLFNRQAAAAALEVMHWRPGKDENSIAYWIVMENWNKCVEIGASAVQSLIAVLMDGNKDQRMAAADALGSIGDPRAAEALIAMQGDKDNDIRDAAAFALGKMNDPSAIKPLISMMQFGNVTKRRSAAEALVRLYLSKKLDEQMIQLIVAKRESIAAPHTDKSEPHYDHDREYATESCDSHIDRTEHVDEGIGVNFPL